MILTIDNYDSFTYNIVQGLGALGAEVKVVRNDEIDVAGIVADSDPDREYDETINKAKAAFAAVRFAETL